MANTTYEELRLTSYLADANIGYIEELYETFLKDPSTLSPQWQEYFSSLGTNGQAATPDISHKDIRDRFVQMAKQPRLAQATAQVSASPQQEKVDALITAFRRFGHLNANTNPLGYKDPTDARLTLEHYGLSASDLKSEFLSRELLSRPQAPLQDILESLNNIYCGTIGIEYSRIADEVERAWLREYCEHKLPAKQFNAESKKHFLERLSAAEGLEKFLDSKYPGQKRFSIEGGDSLIPMLDHLARIARAADMHEIVIGMAHRGRLNVLLNILGQSPNELFQEFEGTKDYGLTTGDVKYHRGFSSDMATDAGPMHLSLMFNPSHLEFINAVAMGSVRARQEREKAQSKYDYAMAVVIHGDAAFCGQGVVMETLSMSQTRAYHIGGAIHIIINNQVGFTTSDPRDSRSSHYCSDVARMIDAPVFHVNADDPEAVIKVMELAYEYRMQFHKDIVIDLVCYRRHGHQEVDEPRATQPLMYQIIRSHPTTRAIYAEQLTKAGVIDGAFEKQLIDDCRAALDEGRSTVKLVREGLSDHHAANWTPYLDQSWQTQVDTSVPRDKLLSLANRLEALPEGFTLQRNVNMIMTARKKMTLGEQALDWGYAETMAYATLLEEGVPVRLSGEDCRRGTFFHRHAALHDQNTGEVYMPLQHLSDNEAHVQIYDSLLSEAGPLGFEYGYATADPKALVIWEAQFGDFANGAQVIIDQFMSSAWQKWNRLSGLVLLLPHGNEGMGPEHSSARLERFLQLCAQDNMQVCVPTTPSQIFHLLRRQAVRPYRKPLIVMSPKSLLRHKMAVSTLDELAKGQFQTLIPESDDIDPAKVEQLVITYGKIYYELISRRREQEINNIAIIRVEQLYPFPYEELKAQLAHYPNLKHVVWCQEEPKNQGAWFTTHDRILKCTGEQHSLSYVGRESMAAPAAGYPALHKKQEEAFVKEALTIKQ